KRAKILGKLGIFTVQSLLAHYPARYTDFSQPMPLADAPYGENCVVKAEIYGKTSGVRISGGRQIFKVSAGDDTGSLTITFFSPYPLNNLNIGESYLFYGKVNGQFGAREMASPEFILANSEKPLVPVYHLTQGVTSKYIGSCVKNAFNALEGKIVDPMPNDLIKSYNLPDYRNALYQIHFPTE
ncbi:MAG: ATP-dependent DNA helicase RecG, partial [Oscillospiraceae bacterium]